MDNQGNLQNEIEVKLDLETFTNYLKLTGFLGQIDREMNQVNCFFDTEARAVSKAGWALRVRVESDRGLVTLKSRTAEPGLAVVRQEIEEVIPRGDALDVTELQKDIHELDIEPIRFLKTALGEFQLGRLVYFENRRQTKQFRMGDYDYNLEIDTTSFPDGSTDYELEIELPELDRLDVVENAVRRMFQSLDIPFVRQEKSKLERALEKAHLQ